ncbi:hypothetical protein EVAR_56963_1 [Eumeta japonica]|uniref:Uncharacterized protein n=1 Tax=Eumeta variegata TaxID=151549 RepID=A0A4C1YS21_EUMVA|nr:hypothetical protein EVAR_56963_1 [Eumeta japonica]
MVPSPGPARGRAGAPAALCTVYDAVAMYTETQIAGIAAGAAREAFAERAARVLQHARAARGQRERAARGQVRADAAADHRRGEFAARPAAPTSPIVCDVSWKRCAAVNDLRLRDTTESNVTAAKSYPSNRLTSRNICVDVLAI